MRTDLKTIALENVRSNLEVELNRPYNDLFEESILQTGEVAYHEMRDVAVQATDELKALKLNIEMLKDLRSRLHFMNEEIRYLLKV